MKSLKKNIIYKKNMKNKQEGISAIKNIIDSLGIFITLVNVSPDYRILSIKNQLQYKNSTIRMIVAKNIEGLISNIETIIKKNKLKPEDYKENLEKFYLKAINYECSGSDTSLDIKLSYEYAAEKLKEKIKF